MLFFLAIMLATASSSASSGLFNCTIAQGLGLADGGLNPTVYTDHVMSETSASFWFDSASGIMRYLDQEPVEYQVLARSSDDRDLVAKRELQFNDVPILYVLRIRTWEDPVSFLLMTGSVVFAGACTEQ